MSQVNNLTAVISPQVTSITATLDPAIIEQAKLNLFELAQQKGFVGTFEDFLHALVPTPNEIISTDINNDLKLGSDNKLFVNTQTHLTQADW